jgi:hypothetical protein
MDFSYYGTPNRPYQQQYMAMSSNAFPHTAMDHETPASGVSAPPALYRPSIYHADMMNPSSFPNTHGAAAPHPACPTPPGCINR